MSDTELVQTRNLNLYYLEVIMNAQIEERKLCKRYCAIIGDEDICCRLLKTGMIILEVNLSSHNCEGPLISEPGI